LIKEKQRKQEKKEIHCSKQPISPAQSKLIPKQLNARQMIPEGMPIVPPHTSNSPPSPTQSRSPLPPPPLPNRGVFELALTFFVVGLRQSPLPRPQLRQSPHPQSSLLLRHGRIPKINRLVPRRHRRRHPSSQHRHPHPRNRVSTHAVDNRHVRC